MKQSVTSTFRLYNPHPSKSKKGAEAPFVVQTNLSVIKLLLVYDDER